MVGHNHSTYHSKYNGIERYWGGLERSWNGYLLDSVQGVLRRGSQFVWRTAQTTSHLLQGVYQKGLKLCSKEKQALEKRLVRLCQPGGFAARGVKQGSQLVGRNHPFPVPHQCQLINDVCNSFGSVETAGNLGVAKGRIGLADGPAYGFQICLKPGKFGGISLVPPQLGVIHTDDAADQLRQPLLHPSCDPSPARAGPHAEPPLPRSLTIEAMNNNPAGPLIRARVCWKNFLFSAAMLSFKRKA